jgi:tRNA pseudouridine38-40 synthase
LARFKLYIEYEGTRYSGWQVQKNSRTVQGILLDAAKQIFKNEKIDIQGSGRTDSGVHALNQVAHLDVKTILAPEIIRMKFNDLLPHDINLIEVEKASNNFHARHDVEKRSYIYQVAKRRTAFGKNFVWWIKDNLNINSMEAASKLFQGMHDFVSFTDDEKTEKSTKAFIDNILIKETDSLILIRITGSHFLWKMVRRIVGVLVEAGRGKLSNAEIQKYLTVYSNEPAKYTAPPSGLFLEKILYKGEKLMPELTPVINISGLNKYNKY